MDTLFTNIQQSLQQNSQQNDKNSLLQRQQMNQDKINQLLEQSAQALACGPTCQKLKISEELKQKYLDAETNIQTAPIKLEETKKNYYIYTQGRPVYDNMLEEELKQKSETISQLLAENFNDEVSSALTMNQYLNTALINSNYTKELLKEYTTKNEELSVQLRNSQGDILTNDRKTFYENDALDRLQLWYKVWWYMYYLLVIVFVIAIFLSPSETSFIKKAIIFILLFFYPLYIDYLVRCIYGLFTSFTNNLPKSVYNDL